MRYGIYEVTGMLPYRGHKQGETFAGRLDRNAEIRAINRGNIRLLEEIEPTLPPEHGLPDGWIPADTHASNRRPARGVSRERSK